MTLSSACLSHQDIDALLSDLIAPDRQRDLETHLSDCAACRSAVESRIGDESWWRQLHVSLSTAEGPLDADKDAMGIPHHAVTDKQLLELLGPSDDPQNLGRIGGYEVIGLLGKGGMGVVFKAFDRSLNRFVAIKLLLPHLAESAAARKRFEREGQAIAAVVDDHVMAVHAVDQWQGIPYLVMTYSRGVSLQKRLDQEGALELREILRIGLQTARGLAAAHAQGIVHRDVKPANIFLDAHVERVQLMDFGLARAADDASLTRSGMLAGTPQYMSPEQARGESVDHRSDLFSLGSILYSLCTGRPAFRAENAYGILRRITDTDPRAIRDINPEIPDWLCRIIDRLMAKHPSDRFQSANEVADLLERCLAHLQQPTQVALPTSLVSPQSVANASVSSVTSKWSVQSLIRVGAIAMMCMVGFLAAGALAWQFTAPPPIAGDWSGEQWKAIELQTEGEAEGWYVGRFVDADGRQGKLTLRWSRAQQRYNGEWRVDDEAFGELTVRLKSKENLRGAVVIDPLARTNAKTPRLRDFSWESKDKNFFEKVSQNKASGDRAFASGAASFGGTAGFGETAGGGKANSSDARFPGVKGSPGSEGNAASAEGKFSTRGFAAGSATTNARLPGGLGFQAKSDQDADSARKAIADLGSALDIGSGFLASSVLVARLREGAEKLREAEAALAAVDRKINYLRVKMQELETQVEEQETQYGKGNVKDSRLEALRQLQENLTAQRTNYLRQQQIMRKRLAEAEAEREVFQSLLQERIQAMQAVVEADQYKQKQITDAYEAGLVPNSERLEMEQQVGLNRGKLRELQILLAYFSKLGTPEIAEEEAEIAEEEAEVTEDETEEKTEKREISNDQRDEGEDAEEAFKASDADEGSGEQ